ncbi:MAG TPA: acyltransferase family protein [Smithellaceae bacterium]|nr:acyltransferase family protein [Smithellaceae bacterium]
MKYTALPERNIRFDAIRGLAIIMVLIIHSSTVYADSALEKNIGHWMAKNARPCMAIFLFLAGYFFYNTKLNVTSLWSRFKRIIIPYLVFSSLVYLYSYRTRAFHYILANYDKVVFDLVK